MFFVRDGETYIEGYYMQQQALVTGLKARRPHRGEYRKTPPLFEIMATDIPRDVTSGLIRFRLGGSAAQGRYTIKYQPEDDCAGGFCEARPCREGDCSRQRHHLSHLQQPMMDPRRCSALAEARGSIDRRSASFAFLA